MDQQSIYLLCSLLSSLTCHLDLISFYYYYLSSGCKQNPLFTWYHSQKYKIQQITFPHSCKCFSNNNKIIQCMPMHRKIKPSPKRVPTRQDRMFELYTNLDVARSVYTLWSVASRISLTTTI